MHEGHAADGRHDREVVCDADLRKIGQEFADLRHLCLDQAMCRSKSEDRSKRRVVLHSDGLPPVLPWQQSPPAPPPPEAEMHAPVHPTLGVCDVTGWVERSTRPRKHQRGGNDAEVVATSSTPARVDAHRRTVAHGRPAGVMRNSMRSAALSHLASSGHLTTPIAPHSHYESCAKRDGQVLAQPATWGHVRSLHLPSVTTPPTRSLFTGPAHPRTPGLYAPRDRAQGGGWGIEVVPVVLPRTSTGSLLPSIPRRPSPAAFMGAF